MASKNRSRHVMKENRVPIGKKKVNLEKKGELGYELELVENQGLSKRKNTSKIHLNKKSNKIESNVFSIDNINEMPTDTSLSKSIKRPRSRLSTIKELEEKAAHSNIKAKINSKPTKTNNVPVSLENNGNLTEGSTKLIRELCKETNSIEELNNTVNDMVPIPPIEEVVLSPFVCTTRGKKWVPPSRKSSKLSELFSKYEDNNMADAYRKKLDEKTIELQNKVKYWTELSSEDNINIPEAIKDEIDVVCGQTKLLTTDKFMQMRTLIEEFDNKLGSMPITTTDLDGFWDMLLLQVEKLEGQFSQLEILKDNSWAAIKPIAIKVLLNKGSKLKKGPVVKSKFADFIKNQKLKINAASKNHNSVTVKESKNHFNEMKLSNSTCLISSTPTASNQKISNFSPILLKTMELSYVARRSGMTPLVLNEPHESPLKPALKKPEQEKGVKRKNIHFETPKTDDGFVSYENAPNDYSTPKKSSVQNRIATPHTLKILSVNKNDIPQNISCCATECAQSNVKIKSNVRTKLSKEKSVIRKMADSQKTVSVRPHKRGTSSSTDIDFNIKSKKIVTKTNEKIPVVDTKVNESCSTRRSSRLANKPSKNYKV